MIIVIGSARAAPGRCPELAAAARAMSRATRGDRGCHSYGFYADLDDEHTIVSVEIWDSQDALDEHMDHAHTHAFLALAPGLVETAPTLAIHQVADPG